MRDTTRNIWLSSILVALALGWTGCNAILGIDAADLGSIGGGGQGGKSNSTAALTGTGSMQGSVVTGVGGAMTTTTSMSDVSVAVGSGGMGGAPITTSNASTTAQGMGGMGAAMTSGNTSTANATVSNTSGVGGAPGCIDADCPGPTNQCEHPQCVSNMCSMYYVAAGTACFSGECNGFGACVAGPATTSGTSTSNTSTSSGMGGAPSSGATSGTGGGFLCADPSDCLAAAASLGYQNSCVTIGCNGICSFTKIACQVKTGTCIGTNSCDGGGHCLLEPHVCLM